MLTGMLGRLTATILYEKALAFAKAHRHNEPSQPETAEFLQDLDVKLRAALDINEHSTYVIPQQPHNWKDGIKRAFIYIPRFDAPMIVSNARP